MGLPLLKHLGLEVTLLNLVTSISLLGFRFLLSTQLLSFFTCCLARWEKELKCWLPVYKQTQRAAGFVKKGSLELRLAIGLHVFYGCVGTTAAELSSCDGPCGPHSQKFYYLALHRKRLPNPALENFKNLYIQDSVALRKWKLGCGIFILNLFVVSEVLHTM